MNHPRVVIDTNIFISGIGWGGLPLKVLELWRNDKITLVTSLEIIEEIERIIKELNLSEESWGEWKSLIIKNARLKEVNHDSYP